MGAPKQPKITKIYKKSSSKRIRNQGLQKDSVWKGSNLWNWRQLYTFNTFYKGQGIPKVRQNGSQNGAPGHPKSQKTRKASAQKNSKKQHCQKWDNSSKMTLKVNKNKCKNIDQTKHWQMDQNVIQNVGALWPGRLLFELFFGTCFFRAPRASQGPKMNDFGSQNGPPKLPKWWPRDPSRHRKCNISDGCLKAELESGRVIPKKIYVKKVLRRCSAQRAQSAAALLGV